MKSGKFNLNEVVILFGLLVASLVILSFLMGGSDNNNNTGGLYSFFMSPLGFFKSFFNDFIYVDLDSMDSLYGFFCTTDEECPEGFYCDDGICLDYFKQECTEETASEDCSEDQVCEKGYCVEIVIDVVSKDFSVGDVFFTDDKTGCELVITDDKCMCEAASIFNAIKNVFKTLFAPFNWLFGGNPEEWRASDNNCNQQGRTQNCPDKENNNKPVSIPCGGDVKLVEVVQPAETKSVCEEVIVNYENSDPEVCDYVKKRIEDIKTKPAVKFGKGIGDRCVCPDYSSDSSIIPNYNEIVKPEDTYPVMDLKEGFFGRGPKCKTENFFIDGNIDAATCREIGRKLEYEWDKQRLDWSAMNMPKLEDNAYTNFIIIHVIRGGSKRNWNTFTPVNVEVDLGGPAGGGLSGSYKNKMELNGNKNDIMNSMIPRNVQKMINAVQYDTRIPVWLHEGMPLMEDHKSQDEKCEDFIKTLEQVLPKKNNPNLMKNIFSEMGPRERPKTHSDFYKQGATVVDFLVRKYNTPNSNYDAFGKYYFYNAFVRGGVNNLYGINSPYQTRAVNSFEKSLFDNYGFNSIEELQAAWIVDLESQLGAGKTGRGYREMAKAPGACNICNCEQA